MILVTTGLCWVTFMSFTLLAFFRFEETASFGSESLHAVIVRMILQIAVLMSIGLVLSVSVVIKSDDQEKNRKFWSYITWRIIPQKTSTKLTFLSPEKNGSSFVTYVISTSLEIALKVSSSERRRVFYWRKVSKFLLAALFANARRVDVTCS